jgi:hypothetical protein
MSRTTPALDRALTARGCESGYSLECVSNDGDIIKLDDSSV